MKKAKLLLAFIIVKIARSNFLVVKTFSDRGVSLGLKVAQIQNATGGNIDVGTTANSQSKIIYEGNRHVGFALKAIPFWVDKKTISLQFRLFSFDSPIVLRSLNAPIS